MHCIHQETVTSNPSVIRTFKRRECLPMIQHLLWQIDSGMVRTLTFQERGAVITLGFWSTGDIIGYPLAGIDPYEIECLSNVQLHRIQASSAVMEHIMADHIHQSQFLLMSRQGMIRDRLQGLLKWLLNRFGTQSKLGCSMPNQLTHQDIAEAIGTTRATATKLIGELEEDGLLQWSRERILLPYSVYQAGEPIQARHG